MVQVFGDDRGLSTGLDPGSVVLTVPIFVRTEEPESLGLTFLSSPESPPRVRTGHSVADFPPLSPECPHPLDLLLNPLFTRVFLDKGGELGAKRTDILPRFR